MSDSVLPYPHVSHSQMTTWAERCQKQLQLERIQGAPVTPAWWLVGGSCVHEVSEDLDRRALEFGPDFTSTILQDKLEIEELVAAKLEELVAVEMEKSGVPHDEWFTAGKGKGQNRAWWEKNAPEMVRNYLIWQERTGWPIAFFGEDPLIEYAFEVESHLTPTIGPLKGAPDRVFELPNGELAVGDIKTGTSTPKSPFQLGEYATVLEELGLRRPKYGTFIKVKEEGGRHTPLIRLAKYDRRYIDQFFGGYRAQVETGTFIPNVGDNCRTCGVSPACYAAGGVLSAEYDPLDPNYRGDK